MKKVKVMLIAIAVIAVTGGLVAAKVNRSSLFCTTATVNATTCDTPTAPQIYTGQIGHGFTLACTAALVGTTCPTTLSSYATAIITTREP